MDQAHLLASHIAHETLCRLKEWLESNPEVKKGLPVKPFSITDKEAHPNRLVWMCERIEKKSEDWPSSKLHRWIGHIHGCALAFGIFSFEDLKDIVSNAKNHFSEGLDSDLCDHLDESNPFRFDIGGEGGS